MISSKIENIFDQIVGLQHGPVRYEYTARKHIKLTNHPYPWSVVHREFEFIYNTIKTHNLQRGYEAGTGFGISGLAAGLAMKETGGKIVSLDAYVEESNDHYEYTKLATPNDPDGYASALFLAKEFSVADSFVPEIGWTPTDVPRIISKHFNKPLDYVFIDGGHTAEQLFNDIKAVYPYTDKNTHWLFHDILSWLWTPEIAEYCKTNMSGEIKIVCPASQGCNNLGILVPVN